MMVCRIKKVKKPEIKAVATMIKILMSNKCLISEGSAAGIFKKFSTAVREFPISRGAKSEKILEMMVMRIPRSNWSLYLTRYLLRYNNSFIPQIVIKGKQLNAVEIGFEKTFIV